MKKYNVIYADPPWHYDSFCMNATRNRVEKPLPYNSMTLEQIKELPVKELADKNCRLFMWTTNKFIPFSFDVVSAWGFEYKQTLVWKKTGNPSPWGGSVAPNHAEFLIIGTIGKPKREAMLKTSIIDANVRNHSQKPEVFKQEIVKCCGDIPRIELFAREKTFGWDVWGNEVQGDITL